MDDKVLPSFREEQLSVLFFLTILKSLSRSALLYGITKTILTNLGRHLKRFADSLGTVRLLRYHYKISIWSYFFLIYSTISNFNIIKDCIRDFIIGKCLVINELIIQLISVNVINIALSHSTSDRLLKSIQNKLQITFSLIGNVVCRMKILWSNNVLHY